MHVKKIPMAGYSEYDLCPAVIFKKCPVRPGIFINDLLSTSKIAVNTGCRFF